MTKQLTKILTPRMGLCFVLLVIFAGTTAALGRVDVAAAELGITGVLFLWSLIRLFRQGKEAARFLDNLTSSMDNATRDSIVNCPFPLVMFRPDTGEVLWSNDKFLEIIGGQDRIFDTLLEDLVPGFDTQWLQDGKSEYPTEVRIGERRYHVFGSLSRPSDEDGLYSIACIYWLDLTELENMMDLYHATRPVLALIQLDNYEDLYKSKEDNIRTSMLWDVSQRITAWTKPVSGVFTQIDRDKYLFIFEYHYLQSFREKKFPILDNIREVHDPNGICATLSIGIGAGGETPADLLMLATKALEDAQKRGGDQAIIMTGAESNVEYFGGMGVEADRQNKVHSRYMADALAKEIWRSSCIVVMGHRAPDMDAVGSAVGVCAIARKKNIPAFIVKPSVPTPADDLYRQMQEVEQYHSSFIDAQAAIEKLNSEALLVVVDTSRPEQVIDGDVLRAAARVAVIDHHRKAATYIENPVFSCLETYASSASELVCELINYLMKPSELLPAEAEALMSGVMLDTKNFTMRTGVGTFEAAALLRRAGGDTARVRRLFKTKFNDAVSKYGIIQAAQVYCPGVAIAATEKEVGRVTAAQAADELLNIAGIGASFVVFPDGGRVNISGRSSDTTNVQRILEELGGGGNANSAGAQIANRTVSEVLGELKHEVDRYFENTNAHPQS